MGNKEFRPEVMEPQVESHNSLFRSERMQLCQIFLQSEAAYQVVAELGELGLMQFKDLNGELSAFQRKFVNEVRLCDDLDRILRFVESELAKDKIKVPEVRRVPDAPPTKEIREMQVYLEKLEEDLKEINANSEALLRNYQELRELRVILTVSQTMLSESTFGGPAVDARGKDLEMGETRDTSMRLNFLSGTIPMEKLLGFERMLWFACRGNVFLRYQEIVEDEPGPLATGIRKSAFVLFFQGDQLKLKAKKICDGFKANLYPAPKSETERKDMLCGVAQRITDINIVLDKTRDHRRRLLLASAATLGEQMIQVRKAKAVYHVMNMFNIDVTHKCLIAEAWCSVRDLDRIHVAINDGTRKAGSEIPSVLNRLPSAKGPPTFNRVNKFTRSFQNIIDAYGVNTYQEVNPALFSIITFPFIFAIMFGDLGHGFIMFAAGLTMILIEKKFMNKRLDNEIANTFFGGRYLIMLMGLFSMYTGLIYNDIFSKSLNSFGPSWQVKNTRWNVIGSADFAGLPDSIQLDPKMYSTNVTYPFGLDPIWSITGNKITFNNSYKMKMAVVIGIIQMMFGLSLSVFNHLYFRRYYLMLTQFIPEVIFISAIFGYMIVLIIAKWTTPFANTACAPSILVGFIGMFLLQDPGKIDIYSRGDCPSYLFYSLDEQFKVQTVLVLLALFCIPWLLLATPLYLLVAHKRKQKGLQLLSFAAPWYEGGAPQAATSASSSHSGQTAKEMEAAVAAQLQAGRKPLSFAPLSYEGDTPQASASASFPGIHKKKEAEAALPLQASSKLQQLSVAAPSYEGGAPQAATSASSSHSGQSAKEMEAAVADQLQAGRKLQLLSVAAPSYESCAPQAATSASSSHSGQTAKEMEAAVADQQQAGRKPLSFAPLSYEGDTPQASASASFPGIHKKKEAEAALPLRARRKNAAEADSSHGSDGHGDKFEFGEIFVHQAIHTIEYCLGCISNTASYLRLWALSLAHGQLSDVLWTMVLRIGLATGTGSLTSTVGYGCAILFAVFVPFTVLTVAVLLLMEGLSAFLHALRLHWVEFNSKFYKGEGEKFLPFTFTEAVYGKEE